MLRDGVQELAWASFCGGLARILWHLGAQPHLERVGRVPHPCPAKLVVVRCSRAILKRQKSAETSTGRCSGWLGSPVGLGTAVVVGSRPSVVGSAAFARRARLVVLLAKAETVSALTQLDQMGTYYTPNPTPAPMTSSAPTPTPIQIHFLDLRGPADPAHLGDFSENV